MNGGLASPVARRSALFESASGVRPKSVTLYAGHPSVAEFDIRAVPSRTNSTGVELGDSRALKIHGKRPGAGAGARSVPHRQLDPEATGAPARRAELAPLPMNEQIEAVAEQQYDDVIELARATVERGERR